jgi:hypothetical protein
MSFIAPRAPQHNSSNRHRRAQLARVDAHGGVMNRHHIVYTRDARVPLDATDPEMDRGWRAIPIPPTSDDDWEIVDTSKDYKTGWRLRSVRGRLQ